MDRRNEELIFDFMAAAEDTGKRLDALIKGIPGALQKTLAEEYRRSPWLVTLPAEVERLSAVVQRADAAADRTESATAHMERRSKTVCFVACLAAVIMPLAIWGHAYWQTEKLRSEQAALSAETDRLRGLATALHAETGGGVNVWKQENGKFIIALPTGSESDWSGRFGDGRYGITYTLPSAGQ